MVSLAFCSPGLALAKVAHAAHSQESSYQKWWQAQKVLERHELQLRDDAKLWLLSDICILGAAKHKVLLRINDLLCIFSSMCTVWAKALVVWNSIGAESAQPGLKPMLS